MPVWGWVFPGLCVPLFIGGGLGAALGGAGGLLCYGIARDASRPVSTRVLTCAGIVLACWVVYLILAVVLASALHH